MSIFNCRASTKLESYSTFSWSTLGFQRIASSVHTDRRNAMSEKLQSFPHFGTQAIHAGQDPEKWNSRAVIPPISMATTFKQKSPGQHHVSHNNAIQLLEWGGAK